MKPPRGLSAEEAAAWAQVSQTVRPLGPLRARKVRAPAQPEAVPPETPTKPDLKAAFAAAAERADHSAARPLAAPRPAAPAPRPTTEGLESHWERRFRAGSINPEFTLDLHGHTLDQAHDRLDAGLAQARAMGARVVLVIAGKARPVDAADRGVKRGAIRAKLLDWLAAGPHGASIAAVRAAHRRHGGEGALYLILRKGA